MQVRHLVGEERHVWQGEMQAAQRAGEFVLGELIEVYPLAHCMQVELLRQDTQLDGQFTQIEPFKNWVDTQLVQMDGDPTTQRTQLELHDWHCSCGVRV